jgi:hypothetical protein
MTLEGGLGTTDPRRAALEELSLEELEEAAGEIQRRMAVALRRIGEQDADRMPLRGVSPRRRVAELAVACESGALALASFAAGITPGPRYPTQHPTLGAAVVYAAPNLSTLLTRLEQDRRLLASLGRQLESRLDFPLGGGYGPETPRQVLIAALIEAPARVALDLEGGLPATV